MMLDMILKQTDTLIKNKISLITLHVRDTSGLLKPLFDFYEARLMVDDLNH